MERTLDKPSLKDYGLSSPYLYIRDDRKFLEEHAKHGKGDYQDYDWRLNRY